MAVRTPLYYVGGNLREMSSILVEEIKALSTYLYSLSPTKILTVVPSGGNLTSISDTRLQAGALSTSTTALPNEATTAEPSIVTVTYQRIIQTTSTLTLTADTGKLFPLYYTSSGNLRAMDATDFLDTFIHPAITNLALSTTTSDQAGTYFVSTSTSVAGSTLISSTPIFLDTRADTTKYSAATAAVTTVNDATAILNDTTVTVADATNISINDNIQFASPTTFTDGQTYKVTNKSSNLLTITRFPSLTGGLARAVANGSNVRLVMPEELDQPTTINSYYLHRVNGSPVVLSQVPLYIDAANNVKEFTQAELEALLSNYIRYEVASSTLGHSLSYNLGTTGSGNIRGSGMTDTRLNGTGDYQTLFVGADDYRAQEFPNGTPVSINTYYLRINKS